LGPEGGMASSSLVRRRGARATGARRGDSEQVLKNQKILLAFCIPYL
jgi:hypothetical protein